jgi:hypothetical protein
MIGDALRGKHQTRSRISGGAIRAKIRFWRVTMRRKAGGHENFFIAKNGDSESTHRAFRGYRSTAAGLIVRLSTNLRMIKMPAAQSLPALPTIVRMLFSRAIGVAASTR